MSELQKTNDVLHINKRSNTSLGSLSFMFVLDRSFKFLRFQIGPLSFEFVSDMSFKFRVCFG